MPGPKRTTNKAIRADYAARAVVAASPDSESKGAMKARAIRAQDAVSKGMSAPPGRDLATDSRPMKMGSDKKAVAPGKNKFE